MTKYNGSLTLEFPRVFGRSIEASFNGGEITSDAGVSLLRQVDRRLGLLDAVAKGLPDPRDLSKVVHDAAGMLRQRVYGLCLGYRIYWIIGIYAGIQVAEKRHGQCTGFCSISLLPRMSRGRTRLFSISMPLMILDMAIRSTFFPWIL